MRADFLSSELVKGRGKNPDEYICKFYLPEIDEETEMNFAGEVEQLFGDVVISEQITSLFLDMIESNQIEFIFDEENEKISIVNTSSYDSEQLKYSLTEYDDESGINNQGRDVNGFDDKGNHYLTGKKYDENGFDKNGNLIHDKKIKYVK